MTTLLDEEVSVWERTARRFETPPPRWVTPGELARELEPKTIQTPALDLIDEALVEVSDKPDGRLIITMPPQEGKSTRVAKDFILWKLHQDPDARCVTASYGQSLANRNGRAVRNAITSHGEELGMKLADDNGAVHEWQISGHDGGLLSVGIGAGVTGRPADLMVIDDPIKDRKEADSEIFRQSVWDWWTDAASTRLAPGAPVIVILTRWHEDDLAGRLLAQEDGSIWKVLNIPAQADHDPEAGEVDVLGRAPGEYMESARVDKKTGEPRSDAQWEAVKVRSGTRTWNALYQGHPSSPEGDIFKRADWRQYHTPMWMRKPNGSCIVTSYDEILCSWDMTFKDTDGTDMVVGQVWMRRGADAFLLDQVRDRMDFIRSLREVRQLASKWPQATVKLVEDKANGTAVINMLHRRIPGMLAVNPTESKVARAVAVSPLVESHNVYLPAPEIDSDGEDSPYAWVGEFIDEHASFPNAKNDDQVDAMSQALNRLVLEPLLAGEFDEDDLDEELAGFRIVPYA